jgi:hypothetical protein
MAPTAPLQEAGEEKSSECVSPDERRGHGDARRGPVLLHRSLGTVYMHTVSAEVQSAVR